MFCTAVCGPQAQGIVVRDFQSTYGKMVHLIWEYTTPTCMEYYRPRAMQTFTPCIVTPGPLGL
jgi:hypothetical protein